MPGSSFHAEDMHRPLVWIESDVIAAAVPIEALAGQQIVHRVRVAPVGETKLFEGHFHKSCLVMVRIEIDGDQDDVVPRRSGLGVPEDLVVVRRQETQVIVEMQRAIVPADVIELGDVLLDVPGRVPIPALELVFFAVVILLAAGKGGIFAQLETAVDAVNRRECRRERRPDHERGPPAVLEEERQDVRRIREKVPAEIILHFRLRQFGKILCQLGLVVAPGEIGIALREPRLGERLHHLRFRESFG